MHRTLPSLLPLLLLTGCLDSAYYMASDSQIPYRWADDKRTLGWDGYIIRYELSGPDVVHAFVSERRSGGHEFTATGRYWFEPHEGPDPYGQAHTLHVTFDGVEEVYRVYQMSSVFILLPGTGDARPNQVTGDHTH